MGDRASGLKALALEGGDLTLTGGFLPQTTGLGGLFIDSRGEDGWNSENSRRKVAVRVSRLLRWRLRLATAQSNVKNCGNEATTVSRRLSWRLTVKGVVGNNRGKRFKGGHDH